MPVFRHPMSALLKNEKLSANVFLSKTFALIRVPSSRLFAFDVLAES
jgi:hypothetical protein